MYTYGTGKSEKNVKNMKKKEEAKSVRPSHRSVSAEWCKLANWETLLQDVIDLSSPVISNFVVP